jgi:hypothetical protein
MILIFMSAVLLMHLWFHLRASQPHARHIPYTYGVRQQNSGVSRVADRNAGDPRVWAAPSKLRVEVHAPCLRHDATPWKGSKFGHLRLGNFLINRGRKLQGFLISCNADWVNIQKFLIKRKRRNFLCLHEHRKSIHSPPCRLG